jgi:hypothetical protein
MTNKTLTAPDINAGTVDSLTALSIRDTSAAYDVTIAAVSSTTLDANRIFTLDMVNAARTMKLAGDIDLAGDLTTSGAYATTLTATGATGVTLPTTGTLSTLAGAETLTNKTLTTPKITDAGAGDLIITSSDGALSADRTLSIDMTDANRSIDLAGDLTLSADLITSGADSLTFTTSASTNVTLPTTGTLATIAGTETLTNKTVTALTTSAGSYITMKTQSVLRLEDDSGTDYVGLDAPAGVTSWTLTLPAIAPTASSQVICSTDANGNTQWGSALTSTLASANIFVGNGSNVSTAVAVTGDIAISNAGVTSIASGVIIDADVKSDAAIALSKLATSTSADLAGIISDETGSGVLVFATTPTLVTPILGVATATTINKVTLTAPATGSTLTIADGKTLTASNTLTFTGTDTSSIAFGAGGTAAYTGDKLSVFAATTSSELAGVISDETGSGVLVFGTSPTIATPLIGRINEAVSGEGVEIEGVTDGSSVSAGYVGEVLTGSATGITPAATANYKTITSISLTAGQWLVSGGYYLVGGTISALVQVLGGVGTTTDAVGTTPSLTSWVAPSAMNVSNWRAATVPVTFNVSSTTTVYLTGRIDYTTLGTATWRGEMNAVRIR